MNDHNSSEIKEMDDDAEFEPVQVSTKKSSSGSSTGLVVLIVFLFLLLGGAAIYWLYDKQQAMQTLADAKISQYDDKISELAAQVKESGSKVTSMSSAQQSSTNDFKTSLNDLASQQTVLSETLTVIQDKKPKNETDWVIAEIEYLLTIAQERLSLERDVTTALSAMQGADNRLRDLGNPNLNGVREQLIKEMNDLRSVEDADITGMVHTLADITNRVESLPLKDFEVPTLNDMKIPTKEEALAGDWKDMGLSMWGDLVKLVEIKDQEVPDEILFDPELRYFLHQNLQLELTSAKLSVLRRDSGSMDTSLSRVADILKRYFDVDAAAVKSILENMDSMKGTDLKPPMPDIVQSLNMLKDYKKATEVEEHSS